MERHYTNPREHFAPIPYAHLEDWQAGHVKSPLLHDRIDAARSGWGLDALVEDPAAMVRKEVAAQGYGLAKLAADEDPLVRRVVAGMGDALDALKDDPDQTVRAIASRMLKRDAFAESKAAHEERLEGMAARMRAAGYEDYEIAEELEQADLAFQAVEKGTRSMRSTGAFIPTEPRALSEQRMEPVVVATQGQKEAASSPAVPANPSVGLVEGYRRALEVQSGSSYDWGDFTTAAAADAALAKLPSDLAATEAYVRRADGTFADAVSLTFTEPRSMGQLRSSVACNLVCNLDDMSWSGDVIDSDGWHDIDREDASAMAKAHGLADMVAWGQASGSPIRAAVPEKAAAQVPPSPGQDAKRATASAAARTALAQPGHDMRKER